MSFFCQYVVTVLISVETETCIKKGDEPNELIHKYES